jgi:hypothetical protein
MDSKKILRIAVAALLLGGGGAMLASGAAGTLWLAARGILPPLSALADDPAAWWEEVGTRWNAVDSAVDEDAPAAVGDTGAPPPEPPPAADVADEEPPAEGDAVAAADGGEAEEEVEEEEAEGETEVGAAGRPVRPEFGMGPRGLRSGFGRVGPGPAGVRASPQGVAAGRGSGQAAEGGASSASGARSKDGRGRAGGGASGGGGSEDSARAPAAPTGASGAVTSEEGSAAGQSAGTTGATESARSGSGRASKSSGGSCNVEGVTKIDSTHYVLSQAFVDKYIDDTDKAGQQGAANWAANKSGETTGVKLSQLRCAPRQAGLKNGDVVKTVNGRPITSTVNAWAAYRDVTGAKHFTVNLKRKGQAMKINYDVR